MIGSIRRHGATSASLRDVMPLLRGVSLVGSAEIINRITHIITAIALARCLGVVEFGIAAAAITAHELTRMFVQNGLGARIATAAPEEVDEIARCVHRLNWWLGIALAMSQIATALAIHLAWGASQLALAIALLAVVHVIYPLSMVQVFLAQRAGRWRCVSGAIATQAVVDNTLTAALALAGAGLWAVVIPKILVAPLWVIWHRIATPWKPAGHAPAARYRSLISYALQVLGVEMLASLRAHGDKALIGVLMGPAALGLYAFASNIANSITIGMAQCINAVMLPFLRESREKGRLGSGFAQSLASILIPVVPVVALQGALAWWYVPLVFGEKWNDAIPLLVILAPFSVVRPVIVATSQLLRASDDTMTDVGLAALATVLFFGGLALGSMHGLAGATAGACIGLAVGAGAGLWVAFLRLARQEPAGGAPLAA
jgi:teichuronic acid exporter